MTDWTPTTDQVRDAYVGYMILGRTHGPTQRTRQPTPETGER